MGVARYAVSGTLLDRYPLWNPVDTALTPSRPSRSSRPLRSSRRHPVTAPIPSRPLRRHGPYPVTTVTSVTPLIPSRSSRLLSRHVRHVVMGAYPTCIYPTCIYPTCVYPTCLARRSTLLARRSYGRRPVSPGTLLARRSYGRSPVMVRDRYPLWNAVSGTLLARYPVDTALIETILGKRIENRSRGRPSKIPLV
jgi:hypothetical protein